MNGFMEIVEEIKSIVSTDYDGKKIFDKDVADILGISQMNFATMKKRNKIPFGELLDFCATRSISINWLLYGQSPESLVEATNRFYMVKYFNDINASAGGGSDNEFVEMQELEIPEQFVFMLGGERELKYIEAINVSGDSMEPTFSYNDIVFINRNKTDLQRGGIFTIRTGAGLFIKRVQKRIDGKIDIISDNKVYSTQTLDPSEIEVVGRVVSRFGDVD
ncbi:MAG: phage repressor protein [Epsilonproteobacteria bacterium]|nr:phage repressor protein [Campylobacterota bacterium]OIO13188.1 MAG: phage repressor protein [Helicobacteraceae bacterium CG1_02_36_14]PIP09399.1 MAG: phage repressor protein [Sulfurimonas sp. CG23_combo_of_CG06-09_8_20_14_all_36_33]PIS26061.1 MAG: phage repressor protein [Sulfurimonas sp. CG08_land_8_20_14_0_20_36_33]PIU35326.1 MAG: phage repressor protein [Sulfurimonas sp. CG07_land_8_20_14_0_80_36_56]PIV02864.1 MAG: phage repressor protein [Sulfurimonas sp. CG03_land_8_20_14_0_80_36_25]P